ncbi:MAG: flagellar export protein FliJ [Pseudomonadota bacterium]
MRYNFKLEPLLNYRTRLEEIAQQALAERLSELSAAEKKLAMLRKQQAECLAETTRKRPEGILVGHFLFYVDYLKVLAIAIENQAAEIEGVNKEVVRARQKLLTKSREKKVIERVKEKDFAAFTHEMQRLEQKDNDDLVVLRYKKEFTVHR